MDSNLNPFLVTLKYDPTLYRTQSSAAKALQASKQSLSSPGQKADGQRKLPTGGRAKSKWRAEDRNLSSEVLGSNNLGSGGDPRDHLTHKLHLTDKDRGDSFQIQ